jgi:hypothetical protein
LEKLERLVGGSKGRGGCRDSPTRLSDPGLSKVRLKFILPDAEVHQVFPFDKEIKILGVCEI